MFGSGQKRAAAKTGAKRAKLHSIATMMRGRSFASRFDVAGVTHSFTYFPAKATVTGNKLQLTGDLVVVNLPSRPRDVRATLMAAQGGIGTAPLRKQLPSN